MRYWVFSIKIWFNLFADALVCCGCRFFLRISRRCALDSIWINVARVLPKIRNRTHQTIGILFSTLFLFAAELALAIGLFHFSQDCLFLSFLFFSFSAYDLHTHFAFKIRRNVERYILFVFSFSYEIIIKCVTRCWYVQIQSNNWRLVSSLTKQPSNRFSYYLLLLLLFRFRSSRV